MRQLTRMQKRVLWMRVIHQLSYEEISKTLGMSLSAVKNLAYRARIGLTDGMGDLTSFSFPLPL
jgi:DNA-directed RNA polymerase specialized sigma24 family protein